VQGSIGDVIGSHRWSHSQDIRCAFIVLDYG
jgi:hypothetical protein